MSHAEIPVPGLLWGVYPQQQVTPRLWRQRLDLRGRGAVAWLMQCAPRWQAQQDRTLLQQVHAACADIRTDIRADIRADVRADIRADIRSETRSAALPTSQTTEAEQWVQNTRAQLQREGLSHGAIVQALALASVQAERVLGMAPFDAQLIAAHAVVNNQLAEMATGEGKTLAVALAAAVAALAGIPVHVVTSNDYLVARDAQRLAPLYSALGLRVGHVVQTDAAPARALAYACDVTYVTANELVFDYLRDGLGGGQVARSRMWGPAGGAVQAPTSSTLLRGLCMAIVDEADAVLIDEARVPLILSQPSPLAATQDHAHQALRFARCLHSNTDFISDLASMTARLTDAGRKRLQAAATSLNTASLAPEWRHAQHREHAVCMALVALHGLAVDKDYVLRDDEQGQRRVHIVDAATGRIAQGRAWSQGLQQLVEAKEGCAASPALATVAQLTFQRFFARYLRLGGLSGTLTEARAELLATYAKTVRSVPLRRPSRRQVWPTRLTADAASLWQAVAAQITQMHLQAQALRRPVLVATHSVRDAQALSAVLTQHGLAHAVLHARQDADEARVVAQAGQAGAITVTTNMAGRGTDIELGPGVAALGGLHVICCQLNTARRVDRQLAGRAARQGDPGTVQTWLSLDTPLLARAYPATVRQCLASLATRLPSVGVRALARLPQWGAEATQRQQRQRLIQEDERMERQLAFGATFE
jgi:preprotein translocase subunit SecA